MGGGVLALLLSSLGAQSSEGSLQMVSSGVEPLGVQPFPTWGAFPFIVQGGAPIYIYLALCLGSVWESFVLISRRGPLGQSGVGRLEFGWFSLVTGCPSVVPSFSQSGQPGYSDGRLGIISGLIHLGLCPLSARLPHLLLA